MQPLPKTTIAIREMTLDDIPAVSELATRIWCEHYPDIISREQIEYMLPLACSAESITEKYVAEKNQRFFLLEDEGVLTGYATIEPRAPREWFLDKLYVDVARHRKGLGSALLAHIERIVKPKALTLRVNRKNIKAINFYMRHGFFITALDVLDIGNGFVMDDFLMRWEA
jgi:ribosomal protein S18 acetylase RimI-like enzyme